MDDLVRRPFARYCRSCRRAALNLARVGGSRPAKRSAQSLSRPAIPTEKPQAARLSVPLRGEADIQPEADENLLPVIVSDSGTLEAGDVVIRLNGIVASKADAQCHDKQGKNWPCGAGREDGVEAAGPRPRRRLRLARTWRAEVIHGALCRLRHRPFHLDGAARVGEAKRPLPEPALADAAEAAKSEHIGLWQEPIMVR